MPLVTVVCMLGCATRHWGGPVDLADAAPDARLATDGASECDAACAAPFTCGPGWDTAPEPELECATSRDCAASELCNADAQCVHVPAGAVGHACEHNAECDSGMCAVDSATDQTFCTELCERASGCPSGFACVDIGGGVSVCGPGEPAAEDPLSPNDGCFTTDLGSPDCSAPSLEVPVLINDDGTPLHWLVGSSVPVTFELSLRRREDTIRAAVAAWNALSCSRLCFDDPFMSDTPLDVDRRERRLHFRTGSVGELGAAYGLGFALYERDSSRVFAGEVIVSNALLDEMNQGDFLSLMMSAAAFGYSESPDSIHRQVLPPGMRSDVLLSADTAAICAMYGSPAHCDDEIVVP